MDKSESASIIDLTDGGAKLRHRGSLPGAYGYDLAANAFRHAVGTGADVRRLLPAAMPASWMVNNRAASTVFQKWLRPPLLPRWQSLLLNLEGGYASWGDKDDEVRSAVHDDVAALCIDGQGIAAVSKVLALLVPQAVPLMDDSAVHFLTRGVPMPKDDKSPTAGAEHFVPTLDVFSDAVIAHEGALIALARDYNLAPLDAPQVLDRIVWYDSFGHRHFAGR